MKKQFQEFEKASYLYQTRKVVESPEDCLYSYSVYVGQSEFLLEKGDCAFVLNKKDYEAQLLRGPRKVKSQDFCVVIRGYSPQEKSCSLKGGTYLPYINGCSTREIFPPERPGDPTWQMLHIPKFTSEQAHHVHSTPRIVYVLSGSGTSVVGTKNASKKTILKPGMVCILDSLCAHHFETKNDELIAIPVHVWSSVGNSEFNHPMYNGTFRIE